MAVKGWLGLKYRADVEEVGEVMVLWMWTGGL
jgi:hypothetical protein